MPTVVCSVQEIAQEALTDCNLAPIQKKVDQFIHYTNSYKVFAFSLFPIFVAKE